MRVDGSQTEPLELPRGITRPFCFRCLERHAVPLHSMHAVRAAQRCSGELS